MNTGGVLFFLFATTAAVCAVCNISYLTKCDSFQEISTHKTSNTWKNLLIKCDECGNSASEILKAGAFNSTLNLEELYVIGKLNGMESAVFDGLDELSTLGFYGNKFDVIKSGWFSNIKDLAKLDLNENAISLIENGAFENSRIKQIVLNGNRISSINRLMLNLPGLKKLSINNNSLVEIPEFSFHEDLKYLDLSNNRLIAFGLNVFHPLKNLKVLILNNNKIKSVVAFPGAVSLEKLDLSHNNIEVIEEGALVHFPRLKELQLQHNNLVYLNPKSFPKQSPLERLYLARNTLVFIPGEMAGVLHKLKFMTIGGNPWACSCLMPVQNYIRSQGIVLDECDRKFFVDGSNPICLSTGSSTCDGNEWENIIKTHMQNVRDLAEQYKC